MNYTKISPDDIRGKNPDRQWWQFWKPKYIDKEFKLNVEVGSICSSMIPDYWHKKVNQKHSKTLRKWEREIMAELAGETPTADIELDLRVIARNR